MSERSNVAHRASWQGIAWRWAAVVLLCLCGLPALAQQGFPALDVRCALAGDRVPPGVPVAASAVDGVQLPVACEGKDGGRGMLSGSGEVLVVVSADSWAKAVQRQANGSSPKPKLFINGTLAGDDAAPLEIQLMQERNAVHLRYRVVASKSTRALWTALYQSLGDMHQPIELQASLGWDTVPTSKTAPTDRTTGPLVRITSGEREAAGFVVIALLGVFFVWCLLKTDVFRDVRASPAEMVPSLARRLPAGTLVRSTYSLARVQWGVWLTVVLCMEVFMWIVLSDLPPLPPMVVALISVSTATSLASFAVDGGAGARPFLVSQGFLRDLVTGWDGSQQLHRTQAVAVNLVLVVVVADHVIRTLAFPEIDASLLALLGVSGIAQTGGKQVLESPAKTDGTAKNDTLAKTLQGSRVPAGRSV